MLCTSIANSGDGIRQIFVEEHHIKWARQAAASRCGSKNRSNAIERNRTEWDETDVKAQD
jgi:hypothetical protein